jgi:cellulose biosynthesis protein BcsQ
MVMKRPSRSSLSKTLQVICGTTRRQSVQTMAIANQEGDYVKTPAAIDLAAELARRGRRSASIAIDRPGQTPRGLEISARSLPGHQRQLVERTEPDWNACDGVLSDGLPSRDRLCIDARGTAARVLTALAAGLFPLAGVRRIQDVAHLQQDKYQPQLLRKALLTLFDTQAHFTARLLQHLREQLRARLCDVHSRNTLGLCEAGFGNSLIDDAPHRTAADDHQRLAVEVFTASVNPGVSPNRPIPVYPSKRALRKPA